jgi:hypothetical protein
MGAVDTKSKVPLAKKCSGKTGSQKGRRYIFVDGN